MESLKKTDVPKDGNIMGGRFIHNLKTVGTPNETAKVRFVSQGFNDKDKPSMARDTSTLQTASIRMVLSMASVNNF